MWIYQIRTGMGVAGISHPVGWGVYIGSFVFWIGIAHSGTLISAILYLVRSKWRTAVSRSAEAMTLVAIMTAGLFPLIHLGRFWVFYYILPYPSQRQIWPNFQSPLVLRPAGDLHVLDRQRHLLLRRHDAGPGGGPRPPAHTPASIGFRQRSSTARWRSAGTAAANQWHHYGRAYLFFAALATPLVVSVHSVVSWDFAVGHPAGLALDAVCRRTSWPGRSTPAWPWS